MSGVLIVHFTHFLVDSLHQLGLDIYIYIYVRIHTYIYICVYVCVCVCPAVHILLSVSRFSRGAAHLPVYATPCKCYPCAGLTRYTYICMG